MYIFAIHCNTLYFKLLYLLTMCVWLAVAILSNSSCYVMKFKYCYIYCQWTQQSFITSINNAACFGPSYWPSSDIKYDRGTKYFQNLNLLCKREFGILPLGTASLQYSELQCQVTLWCVLRVIFYGIFS